MTLDEARRAGDQAMADAADNADEWMNGFRQKAREFVVNYLRQQGPTSGEAITNACREAGIVPHDDRAFGHVYRALSAARVIIKCGYCPRTKGHGTSGGIVWRLN